MAVTTAVLSGTIADLGLDIATNYLSRVVLVVESNTTGSLLRDTDGNTLLAGAKRVTIDRQTGAYSQTLVRTDSTDIEPADDRLYQATLIVPSGIPGAGNVTLRSGWFELTADASLADLWQGIEVTAVSSAVYASLTEMLADATDLHSDMEAIYESIIGDLGTTDSQTATLIAAGSGSLTGAELLATIETGVPPVTARQLLSAKTDYTAASANSIAAVFIDDDGATQANTILRGIFNAQGEVFCPAIVSDWIGDTIGAVTYMNAATIQALAAEGHEILSHGHTHTQLATMTYDDWLIELGRSKMALEAVLGDEVNHFVYPGGSHSDDVVNLISSYYDSAWTVASGLNRSGGNPLDQYRGLRYDVDNNTIATLTGYVDAAVSAGRGLLVFTIHSHYSQWATAGKQADLNTLIDYLQGLSIPILTMSEAIEQQGNILDYGKTTSSADYLKVQKNGRIVNKHNRWFSEPVNTVLTTTEPRFFRDNAVTITHHNGSTTATGWPGGNIGTLITYRGLSNQTEQFWMPYTAGQKRLVRHRRTNSSETAWNSWIGPKLDPTATLSLPAMAAGAVAEVTADISTLALTRMDAVAVNFRIAPPAGLMWSWYMTAASDTTAITNMTFRFYNGSGGAIGAQSLYPSIMPVGN